jgi:IstB-like ATP binding protein
VWQESPLPQAQIQQLASAAFTEEAHNLILVGGTGTRKTTHDLPLTSFSFYPYVPKNRWERGII